MRQKHSQFDSPLPACIASNPAVALLSGAYAAATSARNFVYDFTPALARKLSRPVISVGGIRAGGVGKTPTALLIGRHIIKNCGYGAVFLSRGYGRRAARSVIVKPRESARWEDIGDEPYMLHDILPESWLGIGADRTAVAAALSPLLPEKSAFILDDGFQRRQVKRDLDIVCISENTFDDRMLPAGFLREPPSALSRADIVFAIGLEEHLDRLREVKLKTENISTAVCAILSQYPVSWVEARTGRTADIGAPPFHSPVTVVAGIARPKRFIDMLLALRVEVAEARCFKDHHKFKKNDIESLRDIYLNGIVTTEKDSVRLLSPEFAILREIWYLKIDLRFVDPVSEAQVLSIISGKLSL